MEETPTRFWREWNESIDKEKHLKVILDNVINEVIAINNAKSKEIKMTLRHCLSMSLNSYFDDLYDFAYSKGLEDAQSHGRTGLDDNKLI
jgi:hypothetical protein